MDAERIIDEISQLSEKPILPSTKQGSFGGRAKLEGRPPKVGHYLL
jgi:hypothetical protein